MAETDIKTITTAISSILVIIMGIWKYLDTRNAAKKKAGQEREQSRNDLKERELNQIKAAMNEIYTEWRAIAALNKVEKDKMEARYMEVCDLLDKAHTRIAQLEQERK